MVFAELRGLQHHLRLAGRGYRAAGLDVYHLTRHPDWRRVQCHALPPRLPRQRAKRNASPANRKQVISYLLRIDFRPRYELSSRPELPIPAGEWERSGGDLLFSAQATPIPKMLTGAQPAAGNIPTQAKGRLEWATGPWNRFAPQNTRLPYAENVPAQAKERLEWATLADVTGSVTGRFLLMLQSLERRV
jgi:hypothetical protein